MPLILLWYPYIFGGSKCSALLLVVLLCSTNPMHCVLHGAQEHLHPLLAGHPKQRKSEAGRELPFNSGDGARCTGAVTGQ